jgi:hypothetical protein
MSENKKNKEKIIFVSVALTETEWKKYRKASVLTGLGFTFCGIRKALGLNEQPYGWTTKEHVTENDHIDELNKSKNSSPE